MMALPPFTINNKDIQGQGSVLSTFFRGTKWIRFIRCTKCIRCFMCIKCTGLVGCSYIFGPFWAPGTSWIAHKVWLVSKTHQHSVCGWAACFSPIRDLYSTQWSQNGPFWPKTALGRSSDSPKGLDLVTPISLWSGHFGWRHSYQALWRSVTTQMRCR